MVYLTKLSVAKTTANIQKEAALYWFKTPSRRLPGGAEDTTKNLSRSHEYVNTVLPSDVHLQIIESNHFLNSFCEIIYCLKVSQIIFETDKLKFFCTMHQIPI